MNNNGADGLPTGWPAIDPNWELDPNLIPAFRPINYLNHPYAVNGRLDHLPRSRRDSWHRVTPTGEEVVDQNLKLADKWHQYKLDVAKLSGPISSHVPAKQTVLVHREAVVLSPDGSTIVRYRSVPEQLLIKLGQGLWIRFVFLFDATTALFARLAGIILQIILIPIALLIGVQSCRGAVNAPTPAKAGEAAGRAAITTITGIASGLWLGLTGSSEPERAANPVKPAEKENSKPKHKRPAKKDSQR